MAKSKAMVTVSAFDTSGWNSEMLILRDGVEAKTCKLIDHDEYVPRGGTPLYDCAVRFIADLQSKETKGTTQVGILVDRSGSMSMLRDATVSGVNEFLDGIRDQKIDKDAAGKTLCVIVTDGQENSSRESTAADLGRIIKEREAAGWTFIYLGANQDAWGVGKTIGLSGGAGGQSVSFDASSPAAMTNTMGAMAARSAMYLSDNKAFRTAYDTNSTILADGTELDADGKEIKAK